MREDFVFGWANGYDMHVYVNAFICAIICVTIGVIRGYRFDKRSHTRDLPFDLLPKGWCV